MFGDGKQRDTACDCNNHLKVCLDDLVFLERKREKMGQVISIVNIVHYCYLNRKGRVSTTIRNPCVL